MSLVFLCHSGNSRLYASWVIKLQNFYQRNGCEEKSLTSFYFLIKADRLKFAELSEAKRSKAEA